MNRQRDVIETVTTRLNFILSMFGADEMSAVTQQSLDEQKDGMGSTLLQGVSGQPSSKQLFRGAVLTAVYTDKKHQETRAKNVVVTGMPVSASCDDKQVVHDLCENELQVTPEITCYRRLGKASESKVQPILISVRFNE